MIKYCFIILTMINIGCCFAQNTQNTFYLQPSIAQLLYNSGFAGAANVPRVNSSINSTSQYYLNSFITYDHYLNSIKSGIGLTLEYNQYQNKDFLKYTVPQLGVCIAPKITINDSLTLSPSVGISLQSNNQIDYLAYNTDSKNYTANDTTKIDSTISTTNHNYNFRQNKLGIDVGLVFNTRKYYIGISFRNFTGTIPSKAFYYVSNKLTLNIGGKIYSSNRTTISCNGLLQYGKTQTINRRLSSPEAIISQTKWDWLNIQAYVQAKYNKWLIGIGANMYNNFGSIGFQSEKMRIIYSLGICNYAKPSNSNCSHEIAIGINIK